jgi:HlyD family secretion protein
MKALRLRVFLLIALMGAAGTAASCSRSSSDVWNGYMEGEFVRVASPVGGQLVELAVSRGAIIAAGVPLFTLESVSEVAAVAEASAKLARAESQLENLRKGKRPVEMDMLQAQLAQAEATWELATANRARQEKLSIERTVSAATLDEARATEANARARLKELRASVEQGRLGARDDEINAAVSDVEAARRALAQDKWKLDQKVQVSPAAGQVTDTYFRPGEMVAAGTPIVEMLPPENVKARFFVPQEKLALVAPGTIVQIRTDGGKATVRARVIRVAAQAEYTPPYIYSRENRAHLVFLVEAKPENPADATKLPPGLPVEVFL